MVLNSSLLFFDTFSHEASNAEQPDQLDLVQFHQSVQVSEIRVIPLGALVKADFPGGFRLGATNPSQFQIEFFVNDLSRRGAATFENIGSLQYSQHRNIQLEFDKTPPTDGLLLRGNYNTITLAVYGNVTKIHREPSPPKPQARIEVPQPPPEKVNTHERIRDWLEDTKRKQRGFDVNPSDDDPEWESKPKSPAEYSNKKQWEDHSESNRSFDPEREKHSRSRSISRDKKHKSREREDKRRSVEMSPHDRSWEHGERASLTAETKCEVNRDMDYELNQDFEMLRERKRHYEKGVELDRGRNDEWERSQHKDQNEDLVRDNLDDDFAYGRRPRSVDEWDERRSERSDKSGRRPRTPPEPCLPQEILGDPRWSSSSPFHGSGGLGDVVSSPKDYNQRKYRDGSQQKDQQDSSSCSGAQILHPILSEDMEAISDDDDLLNNLPLDPPEAPDVEYPPEEPLEEEEIEDPNPVESVDEVEAFEYEEIMSDEEELPEYQYDDYLVEEWEDWIKTFSPQDFIELPELLHIQAPSHTEFEKGCHSWKAFQQNEDIEDKKFLGSKFAALVNDTPLPTPPVNEELKDTEMSQDIPEETGECWVQAVEQAAQLLPKALVYAEDREDTLNKLFIWVDFGLDFDMASNQQQPVYKIRHMKAGIKLAMSLLQCTSAISISLLKRGLLEKLFDLMKKSHMALSIKLLIIRTIDAVTLTPAGLKFLISEKCIQQQTAYEYILQLFSSSQQSRAKLAFAAIVRKIHLLEVSEKLYADTIALLGFLSPPKEEETGDSKMEIDGKSNPNRRESEDVDYSSMWAASLPPSLIQSIVTCLKEIFRFYHYADQLLVQPNRWLPGSKQFQLPKNNYDPSPHIYTIYNLSNFLESLSVLLLIPNLHSHPFVLNLIKSHLHALLANEHGLRYLACKRKSSIVIIKTLLQFGENVGEDSEINSLYHLGTKLAYMLHVLHQLDCIAQLGGNWRKMIVKMEDSNNEPLPDFSQAVTHFNALQSLLVSTPGREAIVNVIGMPTFTKILFPYLALEPNLDPDSKSLRVTCYGYAVELILTTVKLQDNIHFLEKNAEAFNEFLDYPENTEPKIEEYAKFCEIIPWIYLAKIPENFTYENLSILSTVIQDSLEKLDKFPGELYTALRILTYLTIPKVPVADDEESNFNDEIIEELKYKYATIQLFSCDFHTHLINLLTKLYSTYQQPFVYTSNFVSWEGILVLMLIKPSLLLLKNILNNVIQARNTDFKDLTAVIPLVQTFVLLNVFPSAGPYLYLVHELRREIINILLSYTQAVYTTEGEEVLAKSLWTQMMAEIFKQTVISPHAMVPVIRLITELLPLPLPLQTQIPINEEETSQAIKVRKLWSAHLYSLAPTLHEIIQRLGFATHPYITHSLRRLCVALSDLSAPMALLVARATLDLLLQAHRLDQRSVSKEDPKAIGSVAPCSSQTCRVLNMLASLVSHAPTKAATLHLLRGGTAALSFTQNKTEEKYSILMGTWCKILTLANESQPHCHAQECLLTIMQYLLDYENAMQLCQNDGSQQSSLDSTQATLTGIPHKDILVPIIDALIDIVRLSRTLLQQAIRILLKLLDHNYGFYYIKSILDKKKDVLKNPFIMISNSFKKTDVDTVSLLQDLLEFCQYLITCDDSSPLRNRVCSPYELAGYLGWASTFSCVRSEATKFADTKTGNVEGAKIEIKDEILEDGEESVDGKGMSTIDSNLEVKIEVKEENKDIQKEEEGSQTQDNIHPLRLLEQLVVADGGEEEILEGLYEEISHLIILLDKEGAVIEITAMEEPSAVGMDSLQMLFANRVVWTFPNANDDMHTNWMASPYFEELNDSEVIRSNLLETCRKYAANYDLMGTLHKLIKGQSSQSTSPQKHAKNVSTYKQSAAAIRPDRKARPYVAPMRGRNFGRSMNSRSDPFRSRPPNTSRPPSLHVDDFVALESTGHQPTGPTGYNKISFGRGKMMLDSMRGRGRMRGDGRGRFFHRPPFRPDGGRGMNRMPMRGRPGWIFRGDPRGNFRGNPMNASGGPIRFVRNRGPYMRGMGPPGSNDRFQPKFMDRGRKDGGRQMRGFR